MEKKLYTLKDTKDPAKQDLYIKKTGQIQDFFTYFNSFSLKKWKYYTTLEQVILRLEVRGKWKITWQSADASGIRPLQEETFNGGMYEHTIAAESMSAVLVGFQLQPMSQDAAVISGAWYGVFSQWKDKKIGISITTFKRETYVTKNMALLKQFQQDHPWLYVQVVDNGSTLPEERSSRFRLLHNPNFGGSGGFTRGLMEYVNGESVDYVLLMDDDINMETSALERTHSLICALKKEFAESFLAGAMLQMENPVIQHENTAYWNKIRLHAFGRGFDLTQIPSLVNNEQDENRNNTYGAWWYCCMPVARIVALGYPLPVFVKSDDMEYGIRNHRPWIHMNGIGVWHQAFTAKQNRVVEYFNDRNMLILGHYADGCDRFTFLATLLCRLGRHVLRGNGEGIRMYEKAIADYASGFDGITFIGADDKLREVQTYHNETWLPFSVLRSLGHGIWEFFLYGKRHQKYLQFQREKLQNQKFWVEYLKIR